ncbi:hypothetical protein [Parasedimentitalea maritima]|uniref:Uncharacterized protein n=1 Tax=Parasedimentitalea maritima TaxID=2578117 RepID=A0A6A4RJ77_9RHOB|nr:hypothetical protein [Zongyanglinia marina]KAE9631752.1 hypothetical protein GP644_05460 [Zongyanglinia marina]
MKTNIIILAFLGAAGCSEPVEGPKGYGFGPVTSTAPYNFRTRSETLTYGETHSRQTGHLGRAPGLYQTSTGVPWLVFESSNAAKGGAPLQGTPDMRSAISYASSKWTPPYAKRIKSDDGDALIRVVTVDGNSFAVMKSIRPKNLLNAMFSNDAYYKILDQGIRQSGCVTSGETIAQSSQGVIQSLTAPVNC